MIISKFTLGQLQTNCYFLVDENNLLIIDPADEANFILEQIQKGRLKLTGILATHGHFDHLMAAGEIQLSFDVPLYICQEDLFILKRMNKSAEYFLGHNPLSIEPKNIVNLGEYKIRIKNFNFKTIKTPGHTPGSCAFYFEDEKALFTGDTLLKDAIGRYDFSYSNHDDLKKSLQKLFKFPKETIVYAGHGDETTIIAEKLHQNL